MTARLLLVDDDSVFREVLARAMRKRGFDVTTAHDARSAIAQATLAQPSHAVVDLKLPGDSGLRVVQRLRELAPSARIVVLTGFASIVTAVEAIKLGATHYLAKPASADDVIRALGAASGKTETAINDSPLSVERLQWEHIQRVLQENKGNISATAKSLQMHRRTLQRKLAKRPAKA
ncbi:MAG TPA: response regulator transcription factor [Burkholderiales bacterium]|nr:response regulator transcription factor [Burkholderiales bacterium]